VLGGVTLNPGMSWQERYSAQSVAQSVRRTLGGVPVVFSGPLSKGEPITLVAAGRRGWLRKTVVAQVLVLAAEAGAVYTLHFNGTEQSVIFRHNEPPAAEFTPVTPRTQDLDADYFRGTIKLMTV
jgi:hypothetical protein